MRRAIFLRASKPLDAFCLHLRRAAAPSQSLARGLDGTAEESSITLCCPVKGNDFVSNLAENTVQALNSRPLPGEHRVPLLANVFDRLDVGRSLARHRQLAASDLSGFDPGG